MLRVDPCCSFNMYGPNGRNIVQYYCEVWGQLDSVSLTTILIVYGPLKGYNTSTAKTLISPPIPKVGIYNQMTEMYCRTNARVQQRLRSACGCAQSNQCRCPPPESLFIAYRIRISVNYTGASKSYLTHPYPSHGKDKNREFSRVWYTLVV